MNASVRTLIVANALAVILFAAAWTWTVYPGARGANVTEPATVHVDNEGDSVLEVAQGGWTVDEDAR